MILSPSQIRLVRSFVHSHPDEYNAPVKFSVVVSREQTTTVADARRCRRRTSTRRASDAPPVTAFDLLEPACEYGPRLDVLGWVRAV